MTKLKTPREQASTIFNDDFSSYNYELIANCITQDRANTLAVLREGVIHKRQITSHLYQMTEIGRLDEAEKKGYNKCIDDILTLLQETLGEGKEINSIFKE